MYKDAMVVCKIINHTEIITDSECSCYIENNICKNTLPNSVDLCDKNLYYIDNNNFNDTFMLPLEPGRSSFSDTCNKCIWRKKQ